MKRPPPALRVGIVVAAVALLGLAMCNRSKSTNQPATNQPATNQPATNQPATNPPATNQAPEAPVDAKQPEPQLRNFPATKAPGRLY